MFPCFFFFKNCISLLAQFQDVFFHNVFSSIGFSMSIFQGLYFAIFSCARLQVFSNMFFPVRYIFSRAVFPAPCFFQNVFSRIAFFYFCCAPCAYQFFPECFFQNCILLIFPAPYARMFFPELYFVHFFLHLVLISVFPECFFQNCIFLIMLTFLSRMFFPELYFVHFFLHLVLISVFLKCFFPELYFANFFLRPLIAVFSGMFFPELAFPGALYFFQNCILPFFPAPLDFQFFPLCCSRDIVFFQKIFQECWILLFFQRSNFLTIFHLHSSIFP